MSGDSNTPDLDALGADLDSAALTSVLVGRKVRQSLNSREISGRALLESVDLKTLIALSNRGHLAEITVKSGTWTLFARLGGAEGPILESDGPIQVAVPAARVDGLARAIERSDPGATLSELLDRDADIKLKIVNRPERTGAHWVSSVEQFKQLVQQTGSP